MKHYWLLISLPLSLLVLALVLTTMLNGVCQRNGRVGDFSSQIIQGTYLVSPIGYYQAPITIINGVYLKGIAPIPINVGTLASLGEIELTHKTLIECLEWYESTDNPNAVGKAGEIGCLQFKRPTWNAYCVPLDFTDIWDCQQQKYCADQMIKDDWNNLRHWTTALKCLREVGLNKKVN